MIFNGALTCDLNAVGHDDVVAEGATVRHVAVCHNQAVATDDGLCAIHGAEVDGGAFADDGAVADFNVSDIAGGPLEVLGLHADACLREDFAVFADGGVPFDRTVVVNLGAATNLHIGTDVSKGSDLSFRVDLCAFTNECKRMNRHGVIPLLTGVS